MFSFIRVYNTDHSTARGLRSTEYPLPNICPPIGIQRGGQVRDQIGHPFQPDRDPEVVVGQAELLVQGVVAVMGKGQGGEQTFVAALTVAQAKETQAVDKVGPGRFASWLQLEAKETAVAAGLAAV